MGHSHIHNRKLRGSLQGDYHRVVLFLVNNFYLGVSQHVEGWELFPDAKQTCQCSRLVSEDSVWLPSNGLVIFWELPAQERD